MFDLCLNALAVYGRLVVIGMISQVDGLYHELDIPWLLLQWST